MGRLFSKYTARNAQSDVLLVGGLWILVFLVFHPSLANDFVSWDDHTYLLKNNFVWGLSWVNVSHAFSTFLSGNYHPLPLLTYMAEYAAGGLDPRLYKFDNLLLHALCSSLLYVFLCLAGFEKRVSFLATLLFAMHPMRVEAVAWVTGRKDLLCTMFCLLAMIFEARHAKTGSPVHYFSVLTFLLLALLSKGTAFVLPAGLLLVDTICGRRLDRRALFEKIPHVLIAAIFIAVAIFARASYQDALQEDFSSLGDIAQNGSYRLFFYYLLRTVVVIPHLFPLYPPANELLGLAAGGLAGGSLVLAGCWLLRKQQPQVVAGLLFFCIMLVPALPLGNLGYWADRFAYLPAVGLTVVAACGLTWLREAALVQRRWTIAGTGFLLLAVCGLSFMTHQRCSVWSDSISLWSEAVAEYSWRPGMELRQARAYLDRGRTWLEMGNVDEALGDFRQAMATAPLEPQLMLEDLAGSYLSEGKYRVSAALFTVVLDFERESLPALIGRASTFYLSGETSRALADLLEAEKIAPENSEIQNALAICYLALGQKEEALDALGKLIRLEPANEMAKMKMQQLLEAGSSRQK